MAETSVRDIVEELEIPDDEAEALIAKHIRRNYYRPGRHEARAVDERGGGPSIWRLLRVLRVEDVDEVAEGYALPRESVLAAIAFYRRHRQLFDAKILIEEDAEADPETGDGFDW
jgi:hypothetical protein